MNTVLTAYSEYMETDRTIIRCKDDFIGLTDALTNNYADETGGLTGDERAAIGSFLDRLLLDMIAGEEFHVGDITVQCLPADDERLKDL